MQRFVPFEDQWEQLGLAAESGLIPFQLGLPCAHQLACNEIEFEILPNEPMAAVG
ncbi:hypothetical protein [Pinirhizobacter soli]|jgi:hypothetical protein|uniref:hypothetical protein n=1 Tax=Pinirhizobacter soli TaxID=2786953 RepID=UPI002029D3D3|nr:hypothetical protein [Pinirhizobacter soli]